MEDEDYEDCQRAKAYAENVLMRAGIAQKVADTDCNEVHLRMHASEMEYIMEIGGDTSLFVKHIQDHLKAYAKEAAADAAEDATETT